MSDKFVGGIVTAAAIAPICAVCVLGAAFVGSVLAGGLAWLGGLGLFATAVVAVATVLIALRRRRKTRTRKRHELHDDRSRNESSDPAATGFGV